MKNLLLLGALALCLNSYGQNKKEQIAALNYSIDRYDNPILRQSTAHILIDRSDMDTHLKGMRL
jgi:hypothetical protein